MHQVWYMQFVYCLLYVFHSQGKGVLRKRSHNYDGFSLQKFHLICLTSPYIRPESGCNYVSMIVWKLLMIIQKWGMSFGRIEILWILECPDIFLNISIDVFSIDFFYGFTLHRNLESWSVLYSNTLFSVSWIFWKNWPKWILVER